jgi:hypothetical protein
MTTLLYRCRGPVPQVPRAAGYDPTNLKTAPFLTFGTSCIPGTHAIGSRTVTKNEIALNTSAATRGTTINMALTMINLTDVILRLEDVMKEGSSLSLAI